jgi:tripartite-type tricarboxylate transporter receptor subunit TctC
MKNKAKGTRRKGSGTGFPPILVLACFLAADAVMAQAYPARPVRLMAAGVGGGNDYIARLLADKLGEQMGQRFVVENRPGAGGIVSTTLVAKAAPDGYTLLIGVAGPLAMLPHVERVGYDPVRDFSGVSLLASSYHVLAVHPSLPVRTVKQLIALARARPGELNYASAGMWTPTHLTPELFKLAAGARIEPVFYKGAAPSVVAVVSGEAHMVFAGVTVIMPQVQGKRLAALAVTSPKRLPQAPEVPTLAESGLPGVEAPSWYALVAPAGTPADIIARLNGEIVRLAANPDYRERLERQAFEPRTSTPEEYAAFHRAELEKWGKVIRATGLKAK